MKALVYENAHSLADFNIHPADVEEPALRDHDVLVEVRAIGINPGEAGHPQHEERRTRRPCSP
jgi:NADPH2:quinone reductase